MRKTPLVLLVEDDLDTQANMSDILELDGYDVEIAGCAQDALSRTDLSQLCIVILDRKLPDGNAEDLLPQFRELAPYADFVIVTGHADLDSTITALRLGAADYILKPINPDSLRTSLRRIIQNRNTRHALHQERDFAERLLSTAQAVVLVLDTEGRIVRFNPFLERLSGWTVDELRGRDWFDACLPEQGRSQIRHVFEQTLQNEDTSGTVNSIVTRTGEERQIRWSNTRLKDEDGTVTAILSVGLDVTDVLRAQQQALRAERLAAIGQTMAALAHESRNALQRIQAGIELLELQLEQQPQAMADVNRIQRAADDLHSLLEEVRSYAAPIKLQRQPCNLAHIWRGAWQHLETPRSGRTANLREQSDDIDLNLSLDRMRWEQVFRNLFENSLSVCGDPVTIEVVCAACPVDDKPGLMVTVRDNGPGLSEEQRDKVFDAFYTTKSSGTGLGMAIVRRIVEAHGGTVEIGSADSLGAEFILRIPKLPAGESNG